ncbi:hypothetical protein [Actinoplanes palleronii]|uniref:Uncharacterized protein n=1 Tax=Actinoplanes palleronii TaxID=113570 RepID=A0ABQ4BDA7_9ACTN|nr:hypothetical protein [Actinoplanes palleronii]GIE68577.1 hypothetical protein Apa02nite_046850 [Actinoplanes palleronii]
MTGPLPQWEADTCAVCPAQTLGPGRFDVLQKPGPQYPYRPDLGWRAGSDGTPACVHPYRVGMPVGSYASAGTPLPDLTGPVPAPTPEALELPDQLDDLEGWLVATLRTVPAERMFGAVARAERQAVERFPARDVVAAMRRVMSRELTRAAAVG